MRTVPLTGAKAAGRVVIIDDDDYPLVAQYSWQVWERCEPGQRRPHGPYAQASIYRDGRRVRVRMHAFLTGWPITDHINHDGLDNRRANLRKVTAAQNSQNMRPVAGSSSQYKGVTWHKQCRKWQASIATGSVFRYLGLFREETEAARAYDAAAIEAYGKFAYLNFPEAVTP